MTFLTSVFLGLSMVQGLVNSFGSVIMAAFAAAVKINTFAYLPVQDFGNAFSFYTDITGQLTVLKCPWH